MAKIETKTKIIAKLFIFQARATSLVTLPVMNAWHLSDLCQWPTAKLVPILVKHHINVVNYASGSLITFLVSNSSFKKGILLMQHLLLLDCHKLKVDQVNCLATGMIVLVWVLGTFKKFALVAEVTVEQAL